MMFVRKGIKCDQEIIISMTHNYFFQLRLPQEVGDTKLRARVTPCSLFLEKLKLKSEEKQKPHVNISHPGEDVTKPRQLNRYMELIDKRARNSFCNATYVFPRKQESCSQSPKSVRSMNGVVIYKLSLQNKPRKPERKLSPPHSTMTARKLLKEKIFFRKPVRKRNLVTEGSAPVDKKLSRTSLMSLSQHFSPPNNPLRNSMLSYNHRRLHNPSRLSSKNSNASRLSSKSSRQ